jgi:hypothetical protein
MGRQDWLVGWLNVLWDVEEKVRAKDSNLKPWLSSSIGTMTHPSRFRRRSFGGKDGIWWRKKKTREEKLEETRELPLLTTTANDHSIIGWDPVLCRPIFKEVVVSSGASCHANAASSSSEEDGTAGSDQDHNNTILATTTTNTKAKVQRTERSYGGRKRPYVMLDILQDSSSTTTTLDTNMKPKEIVEDNEALPLPSSTPPSANNTTSLPRQVSTLVMEDPAADGTGSSSGEKTETRKKHQGLLQGKTKRERCASTTARDSLAQIVVAGGPSVPEKSKRADNSNNKKATVLDFSDETPSAKETELLHQPSSNTSLVEARSFFERLDATEELKLDSSDTPVATSKVSRTSRRQVSCSNPAVLQDYEAYVQCSNQSGVMPLSLPNFLRSRSIYKSELYDGFLDDEEE